MLKLKLCAITTLLVLISIPAMAEAKEHGFIQSLQETIPEEQLYRVNIQRIDEKNPMVTQSYYIEAGEHTIRMSVIPDPDWSPKLSIANHEISAREMTLTVEDGVTYILAGKVNPDATDDEQRAGTFWEPVVHRQIK